jgi:hypothetical protein
MRKVIGGLFVLATLSASIGTGGVAGLTELDQEQEVIDTFECFQRNEASACYNGLAQTITVGLTGQLTGVELPLNRSQYWTGNEPLTIELRDGSPDGAILATSMAADHEVQNLPVEPDYAWVLFTFGLAPPNVTAGQVLAITFSNTPLEPAQESYLGWGKAATDVYPGGVAWGGSSSGWSDWEDGSDFAFATYVTTSEPTCDLLAAIGDGEPSDGPLTVEVGSEVVAYLIDFPPSTDVSVAAVPEGGAVTGDIFTTDVYGELVVSVTFVEGDEGNWRIAAQALGLDDCGDIVEITVVTAAAPTVLPSPAPTVSPSPMPTIAPVPTATPAQQLPDTAAPPGELSPILLVILALAGGVGIVANVRTRRLRS